MDSRDTELRSAWWSRLAGHLLWFVVTPLCMTLRKRLVIAEDEKPLHPGSEPVIVAFWHNRSFVPAHFYKYVLKGTAPMCLLSSASKEGAMMDALIGHYGMRTVRGSSRRRGIAAFKEMIRVVRAGYCMAITTDGPKGPIYKSHAGVVKLASLTGLPIVPVCVDMPRCWRAMKAWDRFAVPVPFSRVNVRWGSRIMVPAGLEDDALKEYAERLDAALCHGRPDFEPLDDFQQRQ